MGVASKDFNSKKYDIAKSSDYSSKCVTIISVHFLTFAKEILS